MNCKTLIVPFLLAFLCSGKWVLAQEQYDMIYPVNGQPIACVIAEVGGAEIKYKPIANANGPVFSTLKQNVLLLFKKDGAFMIPSDTAKGWIMGTDPKAHKIITRSGEIFPAKYVNKNDSILSYLDASNNKNYELNKNQVLIVIYKDGGHEMYADPSEVAKELVKVKSNINKYSASKQTNKPESDESLALNDEQLDFFKKKAMQKAKDFGDYLGIISNKSEVEEDRLYAVGAAVKLFISDSSKVEVSSVNREQKIRYPIGVYLDRLRKLPYDKVELLWVKAEFVSKFRKGEDGAYYGTIAAEQLFRGFKENKIAYQDVTEKNMEVKLSRHKVFDEGKTKEKWDVFLSDISVQQTREK